MRKLDMSRSIKLFLAAVLLSGAGQTFVLAAPKSDKADEKEAEEEGIPPWMEKVDRGGGSTYLVPKGAKIEEVTAGFVKVEPPAEYVGRQVYEMDKRQAVLEEELKEIKSELAELREQCALQQQPLGEKAP